MSKIENRTAFGSYKVLEPNPKSEGQINAKPKSGCYERNVNKEQPHAIGAHA